LANGSKRPEARVLGQSRYGRKTPKSGLSGAARPSALERLLAVGSFGLSWSVSGWLLTPFLMKIGPAETQKLRDRVARELKTTFASHYTRVVSLQGALKPEAIAAYAKRATGEKYLINPSLGA